MKKLLNTLYVMSEDAYLSLDGETVEIRMGEDKRNIPLHTLEQIVCFSHKGASPYLMGKCADMGIALTFYGTSGKYLASVSSSESGNVVLRREQYRIADAPERSLQFAKWFISGKLYNSKYILLRAARDHPMQVDTAALRSGAEHITECLIGIDGVPDISSLRGLEGSAASDYFGVFNELILQNKKQFVFKERNRRPPLDPVNALLSFSYALLANDCSAALRGVGLDPFVGFLHTDRAGRASLALDLMEELRAPFADRFALYLINDRVFTGADFKIMENGAVILKDDSRRTFLSEWQKRKKEEICHPFLNEKIPWGLVPHAQSMLLARSIRGDIDAYPPFFWR